MAILWSIPRSERFSPPMDRSEEMRPEPTPQQTARVLEFPPLCSQSARSQFSLSSRAIAKRLASAFPWPRVKSAMAAIQGGRLNVAAGPSWLFTWALFDKGAEMFVTNAVGDFSDVYPAMIEFARRKGCARISANSARGPAFARRLRGLGIHAQVTELTGDVFYIVTEV